MGAPACPGCRSRIDLMRRTTHHDRLTKEAIMEHGKITRGPLSDPTGWYRWAQFAGLTWTFGRLERWQRRLIGRDTDWRSFAGVQVLGWHVGVAR